MMSDRILGAISIAVAGAMTVAAWDYAARIEYEPVGPRAFPLLLAALIAACGAWLVARPSHHAAFGNQAQMRKIAFCAACVLIYAVLFQVLGFVIATALMAIPVGRIFGGTWRQSVLTGIGMGVVLYLFFDRLLDVVLPAGVLKPVLTGLGL
jgi:putative tricarboxylic transport membrane protein